MNLAPKLMGAPRGGRKKLDAISVFTICITYQCLNVSRPILTVVKSFALHKRTRDRDALINCLNCTTLGWFSGKSLKLLSPDVIF